MKDKRFLITTALLVVLLLLSPLFYHIYYENTRKDRVIDEINVDFKIAYFYPDDLLTFVEGGGKDGKDKISVLDYVHMNVEGIKRIENQSEAALLQDLKIGEYLSRFEGRKGYEEVSSWIETVQKAETEYRTVIKNDRQMIIMFDRNDKKAVLFNCRIDN